MLSFVKNNYRTTFAVTFLILVFYFSKHQSYVLFHTIVELFSIVVAFAVFIVVWNSRKMQDNNFLHLVGISYIFIGGLDLLHTLTFKGLDMLVFKNISADMFLGNQFWVCTRMMEALTLLTGLLIIKRTKKLNSDLIFLGYFVISFIIILMILVWKIFPVCFILNVGQTPFKVYSEYAIILVLISAVYLLIRNRKQFTASVYQLLLASVIFTILSELCFTVYVTNFGSVNEIGHYAKLISFFLIYKANIETGFITPTNLIFRNLKESEIKYRTLAENLPGLVFRFDQDLKCIYANSQNHHENILATQSKIENSDKILTLEEMVFPVLMRAHQTGTVQLGSFKIDRPTGEQFYAVQVIPEYTFKEEGGSYLVICQDVTDLKQTEHQLQALNDTKDKLFSIVAHDLKTPFTSLLSYSELIHMKADTLERVKIEHMAGRMNESAKQAYALLENLLNWSRIQTGLLKPDAKSIAVAELFAESKKLAEPFALSKGIQLKFQDDEQLIVFSDLQMSATILRNLISNALKFSYQGSEVNVKAFVNENHIVVSVADQGTGILKENQEHLLEVGNRFSAPGTAAEVGTGLGLVLCKEFVESNGGQIWLESEFGVGTTFYFTLPKMA
jgi:signal transduction histidine kinase